MKNRLFFLLVFIGTSVVSAQENLHIGLHVSPELGWSASIDQGTEILSQTPAAFGLSAGLKGQYDLIGPLAIEAGVLYRQRSFQFDMSNILLSGGGGTTGQEVATAIYEQADVRFVSVPIAAVLTLMDSWRFRAGISADFLLEDSRQRSVENSDGSSPDPALSDLQALTETTPVSLQFGVGKIIDLIAVKLEIAPVVTLQTHRFEVPFGADSEQQFSAGIEVNLWVK